jgi:mannitol/fructose-specific phosphotransferase system IIA component (Ntr-type)
VITAGCEKSEAERQEALHQLANQMINEDKIAPADLDKAFSQIEGWSGV